jgi:hypothetical protein
MVSGGCSTMIFFSSFAQKEKKGRKITPHFFLDKP